MSELSRRILTKISCFTLAASSWCCFGISSYKNNTEHILECVCDHVFCAIFFDAFSLSISNAHRGGSYLNLKSLFPFLLRVSFLCV